MNIIPCFISANVLSVSFTNVIDAVDIVSVIVVVVTPDSNKPITSVLSGKDLSSTNLLETVALQVPVTVTDVTITIVYDKSQTVVVPKLNVQACYDVNTVTTVSGQPSTVVTSAGTSGQTSSVRTTQKSSPLCSKDMPNANVIQYFCLLIKFSKSFIYFVDCTSRTHYSNCK